MFLTNLRLDMNGTHQVLAYVDDINLIGDDIKTIERNADVLLNVCKDIKFKIKSVAYSSQGSHTGQLDFCNWLADGSTTG